MTEAQRDVGRRIAEARRHAGLTQRELAEQLGVTVRTIQNYEAGVAVPYKHLRKIESLGNKRPGWIVEGGDDADLFATITALHDSMERHHELMQGHLRELRRHTKQLRKQRDASVARRTRNSDG